VQPLVAELADTMAVDLLGYGLSDKPNSPEPSLPVQCRLMVGLLEQLELTDVVVVGHDIGGGVAQLLALAAPQRVTQLVLLDTIAYDSFPEPNIARMAEPGWDERIQQVDLVKGLGRSLAAGISTPPDPGLAELYAAPFEGAEGRAAYLRAARALHTQDLARRAPEVEQLVIPVEVVWGSDDPFQPLVVGRRLADSLPNARLTVLEGGSHFTPEDFAEQIATVIRDIL